MKRIIGYFKANAGIVVLFLFLTCLFTFPLILRLATSIYGFSKYCGDPFGTLWWIWWYRYAWVSKISSGFIYLVAYPFGLDWSLHPTSPLLDYPVAALNFLINNEIIAYNLVILTGVILSAIFMFKLANNIVKDINASILAGIIFAFCPNQLMHCAQHLGFAISFCLPLYILCLFRLKHSANILNAVFCAVSGVYACLVNYYYAYFIFIFSIIFFFWWMFIEKMKWAEVKIVLLSAGMGIAMLAPFIIPFFMHPAEGIGFVRPYGDLFKYAARWYDYLLPTEFHPVFGGWAQKISRHYFERSLYVGYAPLVLGLIAIMKKRNQITSFFLFTAVLFFIFSLSPVFEIGSVKIPNFSFFAYKILPMFRVYARMGIMVILSVAVLAGYGLKYILSCINRRWMRGAAASFFIVIVLFEYMNFPPFHNIDLSEAPDVYQWLAEEPGDIVIVEYPFVRSIEETHSEYLFYQRVHKKKMVNGASGGSIGDAFRRECLYPSRLETAKLLAYLGADYMIVHKDKYSGSELEKIDRNPELRIIKDFPEARVYEIKARPSNLTTVFWKNFASWERWDDGNYWRWLGNNATIWIGVKEPEVVDIKFKILAFAKTRELRVFINDTLIKNLDVSSPSEPNLSQELVLEGVTLSSGENVIRFHTPQGETRIGDVLGNEDNRRVSFGITGFAIEAE